MIFMFRDIKCVPSSLISVQSHTFVPHIVGEFRDIKCVPSSLIKVAIEEENVLDSVP